MARPFLLLSGLTLVVSVLIGCALVPAVNNFNLQCAALSVLLGGKVTYPTSTAYTLSTNSYFSAQERSLRPTCIVKATSSNDVATTIRTLSALYSVSKSPRCKFAVRSGGHTPAGGSANIDGGITIDLHFMNSTRLNKDRSTVSVEPGAGAGDVSRILDPMKLAIAGGRVSDVAIGGFTTGGGMSFFGPRKGWACDGVLNFEVVTAEGRIVNANEHENADLWRALRGGSNNLGVVTRFDIKTFEQGDLWGGAIFYPISTAPQQLSAFYSLITAKPYDEYASITNIYGYSPASGAGTLNLAVYTKPVEKPPIYQPFMDIQPQLFNTFRTSNLSDFTDEQAALSLTGLRQLFITTTFKPDLPFLTQVVQMWNDSIPEFSTIPGITFSVNFQPLVGPMLDSSNTAPSGNGGNSLGLSPDTGPLVMCLMSVTWKNIAEDAQATELATSLFDKIESEAKQNGLFNHFKYLNYAAPSQDVIGGYGEASAARLRAASRKYDPHGLFQNAVPGGYKLFA